MKSCNYKKRLLVSKKKVIFLSLTGGALLLLLLFLIAAPTLLSTDRGKSYLLERINRGIHGRVELKSLTLSWVDQQLVENLELLDPAGATIASLERLALSEPLWKLLLFGWRPTYLQLEELNCSIHYYANGETNLELSLRDSATPLPPLQKGEEPPLIARHVNGAIRVLEGASQVESAFHGETLQGELIGHFRIEGKLNSSTRGNFLEEGELDIEADVAKFPTAFIDQFFALRYPHLKGMLPAAFGSSIDVAIKEKQNRLTGTTSWQIKSPRLKLEIEGDIGQESFTLTKPAEAELTVTNELFSFLEKSGTLARQVVLKRPSALLLRLKSLTIPYKELSPERFLEELSANLQFDLVDFDVVGGPFSKELFVKKITGEIDAPAKSKEATLRISGEAEEENGELFHIKVDVKSDKPHSLYGLVERLKRNSEFEVEAEGIPSFLFESLYGDRYLLPDIVGERVQFSLSGKFSGGEGLLSLQLSSNNIELTNASFFLGEEVKLLKPLRLNYTFRPKFIDKLLPPSLPIGLRSPAHLQLTLDELNFSTPSGGRSPINFMHISGEITSIGGLELETIEGAAIVVENSSLQVKGSSLDAIQLVYSSGILTKKGESLTSEALGSSTKVNIAANISLDDSLMPRIESADAHIDGDSLYIDINGSFKDGEFEISSPATMRYTVVPKTIQSLFPTLEALRHIEGEVPLVVTIAPQKNAMRFKGIESTALSGHFSIPLLPLKFGEEKVSLRDLMIPWEMNGEEKRMRIGVSGSSYLPASGKKGTFKGKLLLKDWEQGLFEKAYARASIDLINFPSELFALFVDESLIASLVGDTIQAEISGEGTPSLREGKCDLSLSSDKFKLKSSLLFDRKASTSNPFKAALHLKPSYTDIALTGEAAQLFDGAATVQWEKLAASLSLIAEDIEIWNYLRYLPPFRSSSDKITPLLGTPLSCNLQASIERGNGALEGDFAGSRSKGTVRGKIVEGDLFLSDPLILQLTATPELGKTLFRDVAPFLAAIEKSERPLLLEISPEGFTFPLLHFDADKIVIRSFSLDMGRLTFKNSGQLKAILSLLDKEQREKIELLTTPLYGEVKGGRVQLKRIDMLLNDRYPIAAWGDVDLKRSRVNMVLGITGNALTSALKIKPLPSNYILQLPFKGPVGSPKLDTAKAAAKISALFAQDRGPEGAILGTFLDIASGGLSDPPPPPPTTAPLPWSLDPPKEEAAARSEKREGRKSYDISKDKVEEGAEKLMKKLFR